MPDERVTQLEPLITEAVDAALTADFHHLSLVADELKRRNPQGPQPEIDLIAAGLHYMEATPERREEPFGVFGPMWQFDGTTYPAPVATMSTDTLAVWADALQAARPPALRSRFADLLWVTRYGPKPLMFALEAVDSYVAAAATSFREDITVAHGLVRACE